MNRLLKLKELQFFTGNPSVNIFSGTLLLRDIDDIENSESQCIAIISIPYSFTLSDILPKFIDFLEFITRIMVIKTELPNFYTLILEFEYS